MWILFNDSSISVLTFRNVIIIASITLYNEFVYTYYVVLDWLYLRDIRLVITTGKE